MKIGKIIFNDSIPTSRDQKNSPLLKQTLYEKFSEDAKLRVKIDELNKVIEFKKNEIENLNSQIESKNVEYDAMTNILLHVLEQIEIECLYYDQIIFAQKDVRCKCKCKDCKCGK